MEISKDRILKTSERMRKSTLLQREEIWCINEFPRPKIHLEEEPQQYRKETIVKKVKNPFIYSLEKNQFIWNDNDQIIEEISLTLFSN